MPVRVLFRCELCGAEPDADTRIMLEQQLQELLVGEYLNAEPGHWLVWYGGGPYGRNRYACQQHRGELKAYLREHYGTLGWHPWAMGPHPSRSAKPATRQALHLARTSGASKWGPRA
jgi:hypothetical protein